jgi:hypothetical protein
VAAVGYLIAVRIAGDRTALALDHPAKVTS